LGLSPKQLAEYTDNDILEEVYRRRQERKLVLSDMEVQAWYNYECSMNRPMFGVQDWPFRKFTEIFPQKTKIAARLDKSLAEITAECEKLGLKPPKF
jgi:radical SAM superfamily enzyme YgiQ (UPF0313 family)